VITGTVGDNGVPSVSVEVANRTIRAIIDTGFNGDLELPQALRALVSARFLCRATSLLAGGVAIDEDVYLVRFPFDGRTVQAQATFVAGEEILIGTRLLRRHRLTVNFVARTLRIERVK
jgi:predicted aspartyl protease